MAGEQSRINGRKGGKPKGRVASHTLEAAAAKQRIIDRVAKDVDNLYNSQKGLAMGSQVLMCKPKKGNTYIVENLDLIIGFIDGQLENTDDEYYFMTLVKPDNNAIDSLFDRAFGKATQPIAGDKDNPIAFLPLELLDKYKLNEKTPSGTKPDSE